MTSLVASSNYQLPQTSTPSTYCQVPQSLIPNCSSLPVGLLACQRDPNLKSLETLLVKAQLVPKVKGSEKQKGSKATNPKDDKPNDSDPTYQILLHDTLIFPEGGGQPHDTGRIKLLGTSHNIELRVENAIRRNLDALHFVTLPQDESQRKEAQDWLDNVDESNPKEVLVEVDWDRRMDHMQCHTGQHLISALFESLPDPIPTLSWGLPSFPSPIYIELPRLPTQEEVDFVSRRMQELITGNGISRIPSVRIEVSQEEEEHRPDSIPQDYKASEEENESGRRGVIRTVVIEGIDRNPCCGTHLPSLSNLSPSFILPLSSCTKIRGTNFRLYFSFGSRSLSLFQTGFTSNLEISKSLSCSESEALGRTQDLIKKEREIRKEKAKLEEQWSKEKALQILEKSLELIEGGKSNSKDENGNPSTSNANTATTIRDSINAYKKKQSIISGSILEIEKLESHQQQEQVSILFHKSDASLEVLMSLSKELNDLSTLIETQNEIALPLLIICASCGPISTSESGSLLIFTVGGGTHLIPKEDTQVESAKTSKKTTPGNKKQSKVNETPAQSHSSSLINQISKYLSESELGRKIKGGGKGRYQGKVLGGWSARDEDLRRDFFKKGIAG